MRRFLIQFFLPFCFCLVPLLVGTLVVLAIPRDALDFYLRNFHNMDGLILGLGFSLFAIQVLLAWRALKWEGDDFNQSADRWISHLAQAAEWFPMLGLLGTVAAILQTFSTLSTMPETSGADRAREIFRQYAPAITATGSGLFMALLNILPTWMVTVGRDLILTLGGIPVGGSRPQPPGEAR